MSLARLHKVGVAYAGVPVLQDASFELHPGARVGLVGTNGSGKSTILRLIAGEMEPHAGTVTVARSARIGYVPQDWGTTATHNALHEVLSARSDLLELTDRIDSYEAGASDGTLDDESSTRYAQAVAEFAELGGYDFVRRAEEVLAALGLDDAQLALPLNRLSGGEQARAQLAKALMTEPTLLLLDEPDNHLDIQGIEWLEQTLACFRGALLLVTHDRALLDAVTDSILEVERGRLTFERGGCAHFVERRRVRFDAEMKGYLDQQRRVRKLRDAVTRADGQARGIEHRTIHFHYRKQAAKIARRATRMKARLERELEGAQAARKPWVEGVGIRMDLAPARWHAHSVLRMEDVSRRFGDRTLFGGVGLDLSRGQRIAVMGRNGSGKTTLLKVALGLQPADAGDVWLSSGATPFYCDQLRGGLDPDVTVFDTVARETDLDRSQVHYILARLMFEKDAVHKRVGDLSGGERTRLLLVLLMNTRADLLVLDEPTNHLDLAAVEVLQEGLKEYAGAVLFVSHDRAFVRAVATDVYTLRGGALSKERVL